MLLVGHAAIRIYVITWVVSAYDMRPAAVPLEGHHGPLTKACLVHTRLVILDILCQGFNDHKACPSFLRSTSTTN
jgi:hypothetical protein